jgi:hypothetical protein
MVYLIFARRTRIKKKHVSPGASYPARDGVLTISAPNALRTST